MMEFARLLLITFTVYDGLCPSQGFASAGLTCFAINHNPLRNRGENSF
jgi:hypothetical protein